MKKKSFEKMPCSVARALEHVGEWWNILILRDAMMGLKRFDEFQISLGIAPNTLTRRLKSLVQSGLLDRRRYSERPPRDEYVLTERGQDFLPVIAALVAWGAKHYSPKGTDTLILSHKSKKAVEPVMIDKKTGKELSYSHVVFAAGPAATRLKKAYFSKIGLPVVEN